MSVVVGVNDEPTNRRAIERGMAEAYLRDAKLMLIHVAHVGLKIDDPARLLAMRDSLAQYEAQARDAGIHCDAKQILSTSAPARVLVGEAAHRAAELIVIGGSKRTRVGKLVFGSTAQEILLAADCAVLVLPGREV